jgi:hypothetical protein
MDSVSENAYHAIMLMLMLEAVPGDNPETVQLYPMARRQLIDAAAGLRGVNSQVIRDEIIHAYCNAKDINIPVSDVCYCEECS